MPMDETQILFIDLSVDPDDDTLLGFQARLLNIISADRVYTITSWKLVFDGTPTFFPINQFLLVVGDLTHLTLQKDFGLLCTYVPILFRDRATVCRTNRWIP